MNHNVSLMDKRLHTLISDYITSVATAVQLLAESGFELPNSNSEWACNGAKRVGVLKDGTKYVKHGYGCRVDLPNETVDFDFGEKGEIDGFDAWRLSTFADSRLQQYGFSGEEDLNAVFKFAVQSGSLIYSGYILRYLHQNEANPDVTGRRRAC